MKYRYYFILYVKSQIIYRYKYKRKFSIFLENDMVDIFLVLEQGEFFLKYIKVYIIKVFDKYKYIKIMFFL